MLRGLTLQDALAADVWTLSPPCQPYTRNNTTAKRDLADPRAAALLRLCEVLPALARPPRHILLENVVGFEASASCARWLAALRAAGYGRVEQRVGLSPSDHGVPHLRPRYYCLASLGSEGGGSEGASSAGSARQLDDAVLLGVGGEPGLALLGGGGAELRRDDEREREREGGPHCC